MAELHQPVARFGMPDAGVIDPGERWFVSSKPSTLEEIANVEANPYLKRISEGTVPLKRNIGAVAYRLTDSAEIRHALQSLSDWYNEARSVAGTDPYRLAATLQQRFVSIHPFRDYNGRSSRLLMNWSLERDGLSPSVLPDFNKDIFSTTDQWTDAVRAGSQTFAERADRLQQLGAAADPVQTFGLQHLQELYRN
ncbi:Fic family protein [Nocardia sp. NPDC052278]|uniref:Fic family protein n=1 Tax=unclassified Nocardia TaxID=2637762 RepID=UPI0036C6F719